jgi:hypothetical protein
VAFGMVSRFLTLTVIRYMEENSKRVLLFRPRFIELSGKETVQKSVIYCLLVQVNVRFPYSLEAHQK